MSAETPAELLTEVRGRAGVITLNRPRAMNALTHGMVLAMAEALDAWARDPAVDLVIVTGAGERALCAGGDIVDLYYDGFEGGLGGARMWADEYALNHAISAYPKPYVAVMHGLVLGGGIGISAHGSHRVVTDSTRAGMPETAIGFVPDVGGTWLLSRAPGGIGTHLALTAAHVGPGRAIEAGLADSYVPEADLPALIAELAATGDPAVIGRFARPAPDSFDEERTVLDRAYAADTVEEILAALDAEDAPVAADAAQRIRRNSPLGLKVTLESLRRAAGRELADVLVTEYRVSCRFHLGHELREGVRAQVIDKDRQPRWEPPVLEEVDPDEVARYFLPLDHPQIPELDLGRRPADVGGADAAQSAAAAGSRA